MSEYAVAQMRSRMLRETEGFLSKKLTFNPALKNSVEKEFVEYVRRFALRQGQVLKHPSLEEMQI